MKLNTYNDSMAKDIKENIGRVVIINDDKNKYYLKEGEIYGVRQSILRIPNNFYKISILDEKLNKMAFIEINVKDVIFKNEQKDSIDCFLEQLQNDLLQKYNVEILSIKEQQNEVVIDLCSYANFIVYYIPYVSTLFVEFDDYRQHFAIKKYNDYDILLNEICRCIDENKN